MAYHPLDGLRVLDFTNVLAGPYCTYQLALMGADVIKIERPAKGDTSRELGADELLNQRLLGSSFLAQNSGKRSLTLDLKHATSREVVVRLLKTADVVVENFRPGVMDRLGLNWSSVHELNERLTYCSLSGFGQSGELSQRPAYDQIIQGFSGIMSVTGTADVSPLRVGFPVCDTFSGLMAAFAIVSVLVGRDMDSSGCYIDVSMLETSVASLGWVLSDYLISGHAPGPMGNDNGTAAPSGTFETADGLLNIAANQQEQYEALCRVVRCEALIEDPRFRTRTLRKRYRHELQDELRDALLTHSAVEWEEALCRVGVPAGRILALSDVVNLPQLRDRGFFVQLPLSAAGNAPLEVIGNGVHMDGAPVVPSKSPPMLGEHTEQLLGELGFDYREIEVMQRMKIV